MQLSMLKHKVAWLSTMIVLLRAPALPVAKLVTGLLGRVVSKIWTWKVATPALIGTTTIHSMSGATTAIELNGSNPVNGVEGEQFTYTFSTVGHQAISYKVENLPNTLSFNGSFISPTISGTLPSAGTYNISITGYRFQNFLGNSTPTETLVINVSGGNTAPVLSAVSGQTTDEGIAKVLTLTATDLDGDNLTYTASSDVTEVSTSVSGDQLTLTPDPGYSGTATITVDVSDGNGGTDQITFQLVVTPAPTLWADENTTDLGSNWKSSNWFGLFYDNSNGWVYHADHGWLFIDGTDESGIWVHDGTLGWLFTGNTLNPNLFYRQSTSTWYHFSN